MPRDINLGNDGDPSGSSILYYCTKLILSIKTSISNTVSYFPALNLRTVSPSPDFGQAGIFFTLYTPSLIVGKVPVKAVHLMDKHQVDYFIHLFGRDEMPAAVKHQSAVCKSRPVLNSDGRKNPFLFGCRIAVYSRGQHLFHRLDSIKESVEIGCAYDCALFADFNCISLRREFFVQLIRESRSILPDGFSGNGLQMV